MRAILFFSSRWHGDFLALLAGLLMPLAFAPYELFPLAILALLALFLCWRRASPRRALLRGALFGAAMFSTGVYWVFISIHDYGDVGLGLSLFLTGLFILVLSCFPALAGYVTVRLQNSLLPSRSALPVVLLYPVIWMLFEWLRGWFLTGFPWLSLGYSQIAAPLGGLAPLLGVFGVSLFTALSSALLLVALESEKKGVQGKYLAVLVTGWVLAALLGQYSWSQPTGKPLKVSLVQGNIPQEIKWLPGMKDPSVALYTHLSSAHWDSNLIVWPETALPMFSTEAEPYLEQLDRLARAHHTDMLVGIVYQDPQSRHYYNSMITLGTARAYYHKQHLVPFTEYLPLAGTLGGLVDFLDVPMSNFSAGKAGQLPLALAGQRVGVSICYEDAFGEEVIRSLPASTLLVNVSNDAWFGGSAAPWQHLQMARMRALETGRYLLRATNTGVSAIIDPHGRISALAPQFTETVLTGTVQSMVGATPYVRVGNFAVLLLSVVMLTIVYGLNKAGYKRVRSSVPLPHSGSFHEAELNDVDRA